jgi:hypothetical protein
LCLEFLAAFLLIMCFVIKLFQGVARLQYSMLSSQPLLPATPLGCIIPEPATDFVVGPMAEVGGEAA